MYIIWPKQFKWWVTPTEASSIMVFGVLTHCLLFHSICHLRPAQMNMQDSPIWELMLYEFKLSYNVVEATRNIIVQKVNAQLINSTVSRLQEPWWSSKVSRLKIMDSKAMLQTIEENSTRTTSRRSSALNISWMHAILWQKYPALVKSKFLCNKTMRDLIPFNDLE